MKRKYNRTFESTANSVIAVPLCYSVLLLPPEAESLKLFLPIHELPAENTKM